MAALALIRPSKEFSVETTGCGRPVGHTEMYWRDATRGTTVRLREYAKALAGIPQELAGTTKSRLDPAAKAGPPKGPAELRVSAMRQGVTGTKRRPGPGAEMVPPWVIVKVWPAMVSVPVRCEDVAL